jgi:hypothetical protein
MGTKCVQSCAIGRESYFALHLKVVGRSHLSFQKAKNNFS